MSVHQIETSLPVSTFFYRKKEKDYLQVCPNGKLVPVSQSNAVAAMVEEGLIPKGLPEQFVKIYSDPILYRIRCDAALDYDGPMPGYAVGLHLENEQQLYCTSGAVLPTLEHPKAPFGSSWPTIYELLRRLLVSDETGEDQLLTFLAAMKMSQEVLRQALDPVTPGTSRSIRPGQAIVLVGPLNCGKSFLVEWVVRPLLGGRLVDAFKAFTSDPDGFNGELLNGEVWFIDDQESSTDMRQRMKLSAHVKSKLYGAAVGFHPKYKTPITIKPFGRLFICCNDTEENLSVLPPLKPDIMDKIHLFRCNKAESPMPTRTEKEREAYRNQIARELPFMAGELAAWKIPSKYQADRSGVKTYMNPWIVDKLRAQAPETSLADLILTAFDNGNLTGNSWKGSARELENIIKSPTFSQWRQADRLLNWARATGTYLGRIVDNHEAFLEDVGLEALRCGQKKGVEQYSIQDRRKKE